MTAPTTESREGHGWHKSLENSLSAAIFGDPIGRDQGYSLVMESTPHIRAVSESGNQPDGVDSPPTESADPGPFLSALREAAEHENHKEDLLGGKTRGIVTVAGAYFAVVQTVTFSGAEALGKLEGGGREWTIRLAIAAVVLLAAAIAAAIRQQWPKNQGSLPTDEIGEDFLKLLHGAGGKEAERKALQELAEHYAGVADSRHKANEARVRQYYAAAVLSLLAIAATTAELIVSLLSRST